MIQITQSISSELFGEPILIQTPLATEYNEVEKYSSKKSQQKFKKIKCSGKWTIEENQVYCSWIIENIDKFADERTRRTQKIFKCMSNYMDGKKTPQQCRGHHKKLMESYKSIENILSALQKRKNQKKRAMASANNLRFENKEKEAKKNNNQFVRGEQPQKKGMMSPEQQQRWKIYEQRVTNQLAFVATYLTLD